MGLIATTESGTTGEGPPEEPSPARWSIEPRFVPAESDVEVRHEGLPPELRLNIEELDRQDDPEEYGRLLTEAVFADPGVLDVCQRARGATIDQDRPLRFRLFIDSTAMELQHLRWELLLDPVSEEPWATNENTPFSRWLHSLDWRNATSSSAPATRALVVVAAPSNLEDMGLDPIDAQVELERAHTSLEGLSMVRLVSDDPKHGTPTLDNLILSLRNAPDVVYIVCHGTHGPAGTAIVLEDDTGGGRLIEAEMLVARLRSVRWGLPRLIVLASCQSAGTGRTADQGVLASLGPMLCEAGIPATVAMQGSVTQTTVETFFPSFFASLRESGEVDGAMNVARSTIRDRDDWWMPVVFLRMRSGRLWIKSAADADFDNWSSLVEHIHAGRCLPIIGRGLAEGVVGRGADVARRWAEKYRFPMSASQIESLPQVAQYLRVHEDEFTLRRELRAHIIDELTDRFGDELPEELVDRQRQELNDQDSAAVLEELVEATRRLLAARGLPDSYGLLASLPFDMTVTSSPFRLLEGALSQVEVNGVAKKPISDFCEWRRDPVVEWPPSPFEGREKFDPSVREPLVYHMMGRLDIPMSVVLAEDEYFKFLITTHTDAKRVPDRIRTPLTKRQLLFLGFRLDDWDFRVLLHYVLNIEGREAFSNVSKSVAVQLDPEDGQTLAPDRARTYLEDYFKEPNIAIYWGNSTSFLENLHEKYQDRYG